MRDLIIVILWMHVFTLMVIPKHEEISDEAAQAAVQGVAGYLDTSSIINYGVRKNNSTKGIPITNCTDGAKLIEDKPIVTEGIYTTKGLPASYTIFPKAVDADDHADICIIIGKKGKTATFKIMGIN